MSEIRHLRALQAFDAAATHASLTKSAEVLAVTHGAVSRQIKQLEAYVGSALLVRRADGVRKTEAGEQLHLATRQAFAALETGLRSVRRFGSDRSVTVSLSSSLAIKWLVPKLPAFRALCPDVGLYLDTNDDVVELDQSDVDVALRFGVPNWGNLHVERLSDEELVAVAAPSLLAKKKLPLTPAAIVRLPLLHDEFNRAWKSWAEIVKLNRKQLSPEGTKFRDSAVLIAAAIDGQGVALARRILVQDDLDAGRLVRVDATSITLDRALYFVCRPGDQNKPGIKSFRNWLFSLQTTV